MKVSEWLWNLLAPNYNLLRRNPLSAYFLKKEHLAAASLLKNFLSDNINTFCDLGVGRGNSLLLVPEIITHRFAMDRSLNMLKHTRMDFPDQLFINANVLNIPVKNETFDLIFCIGLLEYITDLDSLFDQIYVILKSEGYALVSYSPKNMLASLRILRGHRIYPRKRNEIYNCIREHRFELLKFELTPLQHQCLIQKK